MMVILLYILEAVPDMPDARESPSEKQGFHGRPKDTLKALTGHTGQISHSK